jgi:hypothetical protein
LSGDQAFVLSSGREAGPDVAQLVLAAPVAISAPSISKTGTPPPPPPTVKLNRAELGNIDLELEKKIEAAQDAEESASSSVKEKAEAWCAVSSHPGAKLSKKLFLAASKACRDWSQAHIAQMRYESAMRLREANLAVDFNKLEGYMSLKRKTQEERLAAVSTFLAAHGDQPDDSRVKSALAWKRRLTGGPGVVDYKVADVKAGLEAIFMSEDFDADLAKKLPGRSALRAGRRLVKGEAGDWRVVQEMGLPTGRSVYGSIVLEQGDSSEDVAKKLSARLMDEAGE